MTLEEGGVLDMVDGKVAGSRGVDWHPATRAAAVALDAARSQGLRSKDWILGVMVWSCAGRTGQSIAYRPAQAEHTLCHYVPPGNAVALANPLAGGSTSGLAVAYFIDLKE